MRHWLLVGTWALGAVLAWGRIAQGQTPTYIWVEGESSTETNIRSHPWYTGQVKKELLSGGAMLGHYDATRVGAASYTLDAKQAGDYTFWIRANPVAAAMGYRLNGSPEKEVNFSDPRGQVNIAADGAVDLRFLAWIKVGQVSLKKGENTLLLRTHSANSNHGAVDCFVFVAGQSGWVPDGVKKPGGVDSSAMAAAPRTRTNSAPASPPPAASENADLKGTDRSWAFDVRDDNYKPGALVDLSELNSPITKGSGFIGMGTDDAGGGQFVRADGTPIRFWSVVSEAVNSMTAPEMEAHCRFLAKRGVNMVRLHLNLPNSNEGAKITELDEKKLDMTYRFISIAGKNGIYVTLSPYWAALKAPRSWGLTDYEGAQPWGLLFVNPDLQAAYKHWVTEIYTRTNPYTGIPLKDDPTVAIAQIQNEDSLLFWTFQAVKGAQRKLTGDLFAQWAGKKYGSLDGAMKAWGGNSVKGDDLASKTLGLDLIWALTQPEPRDAGRRQRLADQTQFLAETQATFNKSIQELFKSLDCKQLVNAENWRTADRQRLDDAERWSYLTNDVVAVNAYTAGLHNGGNAGFRVDPGDTFTNFSVLKDGAQIPVSVKQPMGRPFIVSEAAWVHPNLYESEGPTVVAAYGSLVGLDSTYFFDAIEPTWEKDPRRMFWPVGKSFAGYKWSICTPMTLAQFPAPSIAFRKGYIKPATQPVVVEERGLEDVWRRKIPIISEGARFDPNRDKDTFDPKSAIKEEVDPLAFLVGPVMVKYGGDGAKSHVIDLKPYIDRGAGIVRSLTGEIQLDTKAGVLTVNAPKFKSVTGFLVNGAGAGKFDLGDVTVTSTNAYAAVALVSLDDQPLGSSRKILVQVGTTARTTGFETKPAKVTNQYDNNRLMDGEQLVTWGTPPWQVENTAVTITLKNAQITKATVINENFYPKRAVAVGPRKGDTVTIELPPDAMYVVLE